jgi:hypothetical protein
LCNSIERQGRTGQAGKEGLCNSIERQGRRGRVIPVRGMEGSGLVLYGVVGGRVLGTLLLEAGKWVCWNPSERQIRDGGCGTLVRGREGRGLVL